LLGGGGGGLIRVGGRACGDIVGLVNRGVNALSIVVVDLVGSLGVELGGVEELALGEGAGVDTLLDEIGTEGSWEGRVGGDTWVVSWLSTSLGAGGLLNVGWDLWISLLESSGQGVEFGEDASITLSGLARELDESVVGLLLGELVDQSTREDTSHLVREESINFLPQSWADLVAAEFREEDWKGVVGVGVNELIVSGSLEGVITAPLVGVDTEEVDVSLLTALHEVGERNTELLVIGVGVTDWDLTLEVGLAVSSHVTVDGLDVLRRSLLGALLVDDFVSGKESEDIVITTKDLHDGEDVLEVHWGVGGPWLGRMHVLMGQWRVDIENQVDTSSSKHGHALIVVQGCVDGVDTDGVDTETLEKGDITSANIRVRQRIPLGLSDLCGSTGLVINTLDKEWFSLGSVEMSVLDDDGVDGADGGS